MNSDTTGKAKDALDALRFKKAWLFASAFLGEQVRGDATRVPNYSAWTRSELRRELPLLIAGFQERLTAIAVVKGKKNVLRAASWMASRFDQWHAVGAGLYTACTAQQFERAVGPLKVRARIEVPPYTEILMQGAFGAAFRHPEYMLARDLCFLYGLFRECDDMLDRHERTGVRKPWMPFAAENCQALGRASVLCCFSLLESFVSGIARAHIMQSAPLAGPELKKLTDHRSPLKERVLRIPILVRPGDLGLSEDQPPLSTLFGPIKERRDSFVHCEPGPQESTRGFVKEARFHDVGREVIDECVACTLRVIEHVWTYLYGASRPRWLPAQGENGRLSFERGGKKDLDLRLAPPDAVGRSES